MELLLGHLVGDYLLQNRWMALNKHKNPCICFFHAAIYAISIMIICGWTDWKWWVVLSSHFLIDYFRIGAKWRQFFSKDTELPWTILTDNTMHLLILWVLSLI